MTIRYDQMYLLRFLSRSLPCRCYRWVPKHWILHRNPRRVVVQQGEAFSKWRSYGSWNVEFLLSTVSRFLTSSLTFLCGRPSFLPVLQIYMPIMYIDRYCLSPLSLLLQRSDLFFFYLSKTSPLSTSSFIYNSGQERRWYLSCELYMQVDHRVWIVRSAHSIDTVGCIWGLYDVLTANCVRPSRVKVHGLFSFDRNLSSRRLSPNFWLGQ